MQHSLENITADTSARQELVHFLANFENEKRDEAFWQKRLAFWWEENPFFTPDTPRGWVLRYDGKVVGFLGLLVSEYVWHGQNHRAFAATTWRVAKEHRQASLPMFVKWHQLGGENILLDTTPNAETVKLLNRFRYESQNALHRYFFPLLGGEKGLKKYAFGGASLYSLRALLRPSGKIVTLRDPFEVTPGNTKSSRLRKHVTRAYLEWLCRSPEAPKQFIGSADSRGALTSYLIMQPEKYGHHDVLSVVDYFTAQRDRGEVLALIRHVLTHPEDFAGNSHFVMLNVLGEKLFLKPRGAIYRVEEAKHYYSLPKPLAFADKRCVLAEGDYGC